jgi:hypothetical protein
LSLKNQLIAATCFFTVIGLALVGTPLPVAAQAADAAARQAECPSVAKGESTSFTMDDVICGRVGSDKNQQSSVVEDEIMLRTEPATIVSDFIVSDDLVE